MVPWDLMNVCACVCSGLSLCLSLSVSLSHSDSVCMAMNSGIIQGIDQDKGAGDLLAGVEARRPGAGDVRQPGGVCGEPLVDARVCGAVRRLGLHLLRRGRRLDYGRLLE